MHATPLCIAALGGAADIVALLVSAGADVNKAALNGASPLYIATQAGSIDVATLLIHHASTNIDQATPDGTTPLYIASERGDAAIAALLVNEGRANVNLARKEGWTPLMIAAAENHMGVLGVLAGGSGKVDYNQAMKNGTNALHWAVERGHFQATALLLDQEGVDVNAAVNDEGATALFVASLNVR